MSNSNLYSCPLACPANLRFTYSVSRHIILAYNINNSSSVFQPAQTYLLGSWDCSFGVRHDGVLVPPGVPRGFHRSRPCGECCCWNYCWTTRRPRGFCGAVVFRFPTFRVSWSASWWSVWTRPWSCSRFHSRQRQSDWTWGRRRHRLPRRRPQNRFSWHGTTRLKKPFVSTT